MKNELNCVKNEPQETTSPVAQAKPAWAETGAARGADEDAAKLIRRSLVVNNSLPTNGKDVIVIIADSAITLRGTVRNEHEKVSIGAMARQYAGAKEIDNQLEIVN